LGAVISLWCFYKPLGPIDSLLPFKVHAAYVMFWALMNICYCWEDKGSMFTAGKTAEKETVEEAKETQP